MIKRNHIFTVHASNSNVMVVQEYDGAPLQRQALVHKDYCGVLDWEPLFKLSTVPGLGLPDIKWNELYTKWGHFVPQDQKHGLKYFTEEPPKTLKRAIAEQAAEAKKANQKRKLFRRDCHAQQQFRKSCSCYNDSKKIIRLTKQGVLHLYSIIVVVFFF